jgi:hypothetical protein
MHDSKQLEGMLNSVQSLALMKQQWYATVGMQGTWYHFIQ